MTAALVCVHAVELLGRVAAFDGYAALDFGGGICSFRKCMHLWYNISVFDESCRFCG